MADDFCDFMDIDDEYILQDITSQIVEFRKDNILETYYESSLTAQEPIIEQVPEKLQYISVVVVDTNFLISHLAFLKTLIFEHAKKHKLLIIIPWIVLQELDGLKSALWKDKSSSSQHEVGNLAQTAIKFLHNCLINKEEGLRGQKIDERIETAENNDDKILDCCRYFQMVSQYPIILLSNDKNLCVKAMVHDIITASYQKSKGLDSILEKILSKEKFISDEMTYMQNDDAAFPSKLNESNSVTIPKDNNEELGLGQVSDIMMMDCDDDIPDFSSSAQNQVSTATITTSKQKSEYSSLYNSIHAPKDKESNSIGNLSSAASVINLEYSSLNDSIHAPKGKNLGANYNKNQGLDLNDKNYHKRKESIGISTIFERTSYVPECILSRKTELSQEYLVTKIVSDLNNLLPSAISFHFKQCFDDHWTYVVKDPQPWSLSKMLKFMERYWFTVFSEVFQGINIETIKDMISFISRWENYRKANFTIGDIMQFIEKSEIILMMVYVDIQRNNESTVEIKQTTKNWWNEFESSLTMISQNAIY
ncbi:PIN domain-containing protein [Glomus cerebriforme]|uniref:PIN domain-containing protein n=1 Tax=Glomus cerebriforme TaxID=658196 RepID=A0A397SCZ6_9GLOM|nr:PIN domain-containing protein [Glomus cerebriforme]